MEEEIQIAPPTDDVNERLWANRNNDSVIAGYNSVWGEGAAESYLESRSGVAPDGDRRVIPQGASEYLLNLQNTEGFDIQVEAFNNLYGPGAAERVISDHQASLQTEDEGEGPGFFGTAWDVTGRAVLGGISDMAQGIAQTADDLGNYVNPLIGDIVRTEDGWTYMRGDELRQWYEENEGGSVLDVFTDGAEQVTDAVIGETQTTAGHMVRGVSTFLVPYLGAAKALNVGASLTRATLLGAAVDFSVWDPSDPNLSRMATELGLPENFVTDLLATDPNDSDMVNRLRNAAEGGGIGLIFDSLIIAARHVRAGRAAQEAGDVAGVNAARAALRETAETMDNAVAEATAESVTRNLEEAAATSERVSAARREAEAAQEASPTPDAPEVPTGAPEGAVEAPAPRDSGFALTTREIDEINAQAQRFVKDPQAAFSSNLPYRSPTTYRGFEDLGANLAAVARVMREQFDEVAGASPQSFEQVELAAMSRLNEMAQRVGRQPEELLAEWNVLNVDPQNLASEILARDNLIVNMERELVDLAEQVHTGSIDNARFKTDVEARAELAYRREIIANLLARQASARSNIGRALNAMKIARGADDKIRNILRGDFANTDIDAFARNIAERTQDPLEAAVNKSRVQRAMDAVSYFRINALLSGPGTQEVNIISSGLNTIMTPLRTALGGQFRHAARQMYGMVFGMRENLKMVKRAFMEDQGVLDPGNTKFDAEDVMKGDKGPIGTLVGLPSRLLLTGDEFFKQAAYRGWIQADAALGADARGLKGAARRDYINQYIRDSFTPDGQADGALRASALDMARRSTFTEPLRPGSLASKFQASLLQGEGAGTFIARLVIPFFRTPVNLLKQGFQHMPGIQHLSKELNEDLAAGGARAAQARAKIMIGWSMGIGGLYAALEGKITGSGPSDPQVNAEWRNAGNVPYAIRTTDDEGNVKWISYQRLEPLANVLSTIADAVEIMQNPYNDEIEGTMDAISGVFLALAENSINKTFTTGVSDFIDFLQGERQGQDALQNFVASFVPNVLNQTNGDMGFREPRTYMDAILARTGSYESVAPRRNILGEVITRNSQKYDPLGLFTSQPHRPQDPLLVELSEVSMADRSAFRQPNHTIHLDGRRQSLKEIRDPETNRALYDMWMERTGTIEIQGQTLREALEEAISTTAYLDAPVGGPGTASGVTTKGSIINGIVGAYRDAARASIPALRDVLRRVDEQAIENTRNQVFENRATRRNAEGAIDRFTGMEILTPE